MRLSPAARISLSLVALAVLLVLIADLVLGFLPDEARWTQKTQLRSAEALAIQVGVIADDAHALGRTLSAVVSRDRSILSVALRDNDGDLVAAAGDHQKHWRPIPANRTERGRFVIPVYRQAALWGEMEFIYRSALEPAWQAHVERPSLRVAAVLVCLGIVAYFLYLRRALEHLDPGTTVPERVRMAFDVLTEGVMVLDAKGQVVLVNHAFMNIASREDPIIGRKPSDLAWLTSGMSKDAADHPWSKAFRERRPVTGEELDIAQAHQSSRRVVVNCAPILDGAGVARGCLVTMDDVTALNYANAELMKTLRMLNVSQKEVERQNAQLTRLATRDPLTGCLNRRAFLEMAHALILSAGRDSLEVCCVMGDIDHFKRFNDRYGHSVGDRVIVAVAKTLTAGLRDGDILCRYGGEEFCILLVGVTTQEAMDIAERLRQAIESTGGTVIRTLEGLKITSSFGVARLRDGAGNLARLIDQSDEALYFSKENGRNRVSLWKQNLRAKPAEPKPHDAAHH